MYVLFCLAGSGTWKSLAVESAIFFENLSAVQLFLQSVTSTRKIISHFAAHVCIIFSGRKRYLAESGSSDKIDQHYHEPSDAGDAFPASSQADDEEASTS